MRARSSWVQGWVLTQAGRGLSMVQGGYLQCFPALRPPQQLLSLWVLVLV